MNWNRRIRQFHRWVAIVFTVTVVVTVVVLAAQGPEWMSYVPLPPLALLFFSGLYLLVRWYRTRRSQRPAGTGRAPWVRPVHRWSAVTFLVTVLVTFVALSLPDPIIWVSYLPLLPLAALLISGLTMFTQVSMARRRASRTLATG